MDTICSLKRREIAHKYLGTRMTAFRLFFFSSEHKRSPDHRRVLSDYTLYGGFPPSTTSLAGYANVPSCQSYIVRISELGTMGTSDKEEEGMEIRCGQQQGADTAAYFMQSSIART